MNRFQVSIDLSSGAEVLENLWMSLRLCRKTYLLKNVTDLLFLNLVDRFSIPVSHKLEDMFHPVLKTKVQQLYDKLMMLVLKDDGETRICFLNWLISHAE